MPFWRTRFVMGDVNNPVCVKPTIVDATACEVNGLFLKHPLFCNDGRLLHYVVQLLVVLKNQLR